MLATAFVARRVFAPGVFSRPLFAGAVVAAVFFTGPVVARAVVTAVFFAGPVVTGAVITAVLILVVITPWLIAPVLVAARNVLLTRLALGQVDKTGVVFVDHGETSGRAIGGLGLIAFAAAVLCALTISVLMRLLVLLARFLFGGHLTHRFGKHAGVMLGVLREILGGNPVIRQLAIAGELLIFLDDLLRSATHLAFGAGAFENAVDDIAEGARAVLLGTRARLGRAHLVLWSRNSGFGPLRGPIGRCKNSRGAVVIAKRGDVKPCLFGDTE